MQGGKKSKALKLRARMLMRTKVSMHVETVVLLSQRKADDYVGKYKDVEKKYAGKELPGWRMKSEA